MMADLSCTTDKKSQQSIYVETYTNSEPSVADLSPVGSPERAAAERRLVRRLDLRLLPTVFLIFIMNYVDRTAVTTARLKGLEQDLGLTDVQYSTVIAILFASYVPAQIPSNMIINRVARPSLYIGICAILWGVTSALTGVTTNYAEILACRFFIGLPEAAFYPGGIYLLSCWYTRKELAFRSALLYAGLLVSNAFGSLMAAGILSHMEGKRGIRAWRWLFFIEGAITIFIGFQSMWLLPDYPHNTRWVTPAERRLAQIRLAEDVGEVDKDNANDSPLRGLKLALQDPRVLFFTLMTICQLLGLSFTNVFPTLVETLGFSETTSLLLAAPPWLCAAIVSCINAWHADRTGERFFHISVWWWGAMLGCIIALATMSPAARYVALFLMTSGSAGFAMTLVWVSNTVPRPPAKRAAAIGIVNGIGNSGFIIGAYTWKAAWGPAYRPAFAISLAAFVGSSVLALIVRQMLVRANRRLADTGTVAGVASQDNERVTTGEPEDIIISRVTARSTAFRYLY